MLQLVSGYWLSQLVFGAAKLGMADERHPAREPTGLR